MDLRLDNPYLHGPYAPTVHELSRYGLPVEGELPADLQGAYFRNGPNPVSSRRTAITPSTATAWCTAVYFRRQGAAIATAGCRPRPGRSERSGESISPGVMGPFDYSVSPFGIKDTSNTDVFCYAGDS
jgi:carotenoid cleavage dioxygenase-like enzyme